MDIADNGRAESAESGNWVLVTQMNGVSITDRNLWEGLALAAVKQAFQDATVGDYTALCWLVTEGRDWLSALGLSLEAADRWGTDRLAD